MSDFFGKAGMPWHGVMIVRLPLEHEKVAAGEYIVEYIDGMMADKKEDGFATLSAVYLALKKLKERCPWIAKAAVKTDGAGAYSGMVFTVGSSMLGTMTGIRVHDAFTGESGKGKSQLDGHFAVKGSKTRRLVASALHDIITPETLFQGVAMTVSSNETAQLFQPDRSQGSTLDAASVKQLSAMSHRSYAYAADGTFTHLLLRQQTDLGDGLSVGAGSLRKKDAADFAPPRLLGSKSGINTAVTDTNSAVNANTVNAAAANATTNATDATDAADAADATDAGATAAGKTSTARRNQNRPRQQVAPIARTQAGRDLHESKVAQARGKRQTAKDQKDAAIRTARLFRCSQSKAFWCCIDPEGDTRCNRVFMSARELRKHVKAGKHTQGVVRPYQTGVEVGRVSAHDRDVNLVKQALSEVVVQGATGGAQSGALVPVSGFHLRFADGKDYEQQPADGGWARAQRLPVVRSTLAQIEFVYEAYNVGKVFDQVKLSAADARQVMLEVGTAKVVARFGGHPYFGVDVGKPRFKRSEVLDEPKIKSYFGNGAQLKQLYENAKKRGEVVEDDGDDDDEAVADGGGRRRGRRRQRGRRGAVDGSHLQSARAKLVAHSNSVQQATDGRTRGHLSTKELKTLLADAGKQVSGSRDALIARAREHATALLSRMAVDAAQPAATTAAAPIAAPAPAVDVATAARATPAATPATASVTDGSSCLADLRTASLPAGMNMSPTKAAKLSGIWETCTELADASDSDLRSAITEGRLPSIGLPWLRRLQTALSHLATREQAAGAADNVAETAEAATSREEAAADAMADEAVHAQKSDSSSSSSKSSSSSTSNSELGSAIGTDAEVSNSSDSENSSEHGG